MRNLTSLLDRFRRSIHKDEIARQAVSEAVLRVTGIKLPPEAVSLKDGVLSLSAGPAAKNEMRLKEEKIKETLLGLSGIHVVRVLYH